MNFPYVFVCLPQLLPDLSRTLDPSNFVFVSPPLLSVCDCLSVCLECGAFPAVRYILHATSLKKLAFSLIRVAILCNSSSVRGCGFISTSFLPFWVFLCGMDFRRCYECCHTLCEFLAAVLCLESTISLRSSTTTPGS